MATIGALILTISRNMSAFLSPEIRLGFISTIFSCHKQIFTNKHQKTALKCSFFRGSIDVALVRVIHLKMGSGQGFGSGSALI
jgi:hypothetical protein